VSNENGLNSCMTPKASLDDLWNGSVADVDQKNKPP
jgi:hypothetical protein